ncbi:hypothetical protein GN244_ATG15531 [Phytophthora infestans]|uniref:FYVE-type domain-containing protein n=1 Tax=Phytophthora infestans TaxID=4787 RepID=A0A833VXA0_PHYIN|nr:hypothetical protein GN244_ATG15531 [Phytophthora infestans]KAF4142354.1 hypothetical protein GN958_ATG08530 [Phytophthora infestans]
MTFTLPEDTIPKLKLSKTLRAALIHEAESIVCETIQANDAFLNDGSCFPASDWRFVRAKQGLNVYCQRAESIKRSSSRKTGLVSPLSPGITRDSSMTLSRSEKSKRTGKSLMVLHGAIDGNLDDCMFGSFATTEETWRWRSSYVYEGLDEARLLATIRGPTHEDPFRFLGLKWFTKELPSVLSGIMQQRDFLIIEATGLTRDSNGERVGYFLMHSVTLPELVPEFPQLNLMREEISACYIDRQLGTNQVEMYCRSFLNPRGKPLNRLTAVIAAEALLSAIGIIDYAYIRKLTWLVKNKQERMSARRCRTRRQSGAFPRSTRCQVCDKSFRRLALNGSTECHICRGQVCKNCFVVKKMTVDVSLRGHVKQCPVRVCVCCLLEAKEKSVWEMALDGISETRSEASSSLASGQRRCTLPGVE